MCNDYLKCLVLFARQCLTSRRLKISHVLSRICTRRCLAPRRTKINQIPEICFYEMTLVIEVSRPTRKCRRVIPLGCRCLLFCPRWATTGRATTKTRGAGWWRRCGSCPARSYRQPSTLGPVRTSLLRLYRTMSSTGESWVPRGVFIPAETPVNNGTMAGDNVTAG